MTDELKKLLDEMSARADAASEGPLPHSSVKIDLTLRSVNLVLLAMIRKLIEQRDEWMRETVEALVDDVENTMLANQSSENAELVKIAEQTINKEGLK